VLNLRYAGPVEDEVNAVLSSRFGEIFSVLGRLLAAVIRDREAVCHFSQRAERVRPPMELRYLRDIADDDALNWEYAESELPREIDQWMRQTLVKSASVRSTNAPRACNSP